MWVYSKSVPYNVKKKKIREIFLFILLRESSDGLELEFYSNFVIVLEHGSFWLAGNCSLPELKTVGRFVESIRGLEKQQHCSQKIKWPVKKLESQP